MHFIDANIFLELQLDQQRAHHWIYSLSLTDRLKAIKHMEDFKLDYDDALAYQTMKKQNIPNIISYDKHFDHIPDITRQEPAQLV